MDKFCSILEERWAIFFDECGFEWEYDANGADIGIPAFRLSNVDGRCGYDNKRVLYVVVKKTMDYKSRKILSKAHYNSPVYVVGDIPYLGGNIYDYFRLITNIHNIDTVYFGFDLADGDGYPAGLFRNNTGNPQLLGPDHDLDNVDWEITEQAYQKARSIRLNSCNESDGNATITSSEYRELVKNYYTSTDTIKKLQAENEKLAKDADGWKHMYHGIEEKLKKEKEAHQKCLERETKLSSKLDIEYSRRLGLESDLKKITEKWGINSKSKEE